MTAAASVAERRRTPRRQPAQGTVCRMNRGTNHGIGLVWNLSQGGVSLLITEPIEPGTAVTGELTTMNNDSKLKVTFHVVHLSKLQTGDYCVGAKFDKSLSDVEMKPFVAH